MQGRLLSSQAFLCYFYQIFVAKHCVNRLRQKLFPAARRAAGAKQHRGFGPRRRQLRPGRGVFCSLRRVFQACRLHVLGGANGGPVAACPSFEVNEQASALVGRLREGTHRVGVLGLM